MGGVGERFLLELGFFDGMSSNGGRSNSVSSAIAVAVEARSDFSSMSQGSGESSIMSGFSSNETLLIDLFLLKLLGLSEERWLLKIEWVGELSVRDSQDLSFTTDCFVSSCSAGCSLRFSLAATVSVVSAAAAAVAALFISHMSEVWEAGPDLLSSEPEPGSSLVSQDADLCSNRVALNMFDCLVLSLWFCFYTPWVWGILVWKLLLFALFPFFILLFFLILLLLFLIFFQV